MAELDTLLTAAEVLKITGYKSRSTIWRKVKAGDFPSPVSLSNQATRWSSSDVSEWLKSLPRVTYQGDPSNPTS
ncbi:MAG: AlpA family phage regulatory protein [Pseudomonadota bacterium]